MIPTWFIWLDIILMCQLRKIDQYPLLRNALGSGILLATASHQDTMS